LPLKPEENLLLKKQLPYKNMPKLNIPEIPAIPKIPILNIPDTPIKSTTQDFIPVADIKDNLVIFKDGGVALIMETTSLNFSLLSEKEQQAVIVSYAALLNSLSFPIQIIVKSERKDISSYMTYLDEQTKKLTNDKLIPLVENYKAFINESIKKKNVLGKRFFLVVPFSPLELGVAKTFASATKMKGPLPYTKSYVLKKAKVTLMPKKTHLIRQMNRLGMKLRQLNNNELIELVYNTYNPVPPPIKKEKEI